MSVTMETDRIRLSAHSCQDGKASLTPHKVEIECIHKMCPKILQ